MIPVESIPGMGEGRIKKNGGGGEFSYDTVDILYSYLRYCKNFCKCCNIAPPSTI
jgi:hypothetical protein